MWKGVIFLKGKRMLGVLLAATVALGVAGSAGAKETLTVWHAGSLNAALKDVEARFLEKYPDLEIQDKGAGSVELAQAIVDKGGCDLYLTADYRNIEDLLKPQHATWNLQFCTNAMVIAYSPKAPRAKEISAGNWFRVLAQPDVSWGHTDPNKDPGGYRAIMVLQLAEAFYGQPGLEKSLMEAPGHRVVDGINAKGVKRLMEWGSLGYMLKYRSYAVADGMQMIELPAEINLGDPAFAERYAKASVSIKGKGDQKITMQGEPVVYGLTIPTSAKNGARALEFVQFLLSPEGKQILEKRGFGLMPPTPATPRDKLPAELASLAAAQ